MRRGIRSRAATIAVLTLFLTGAAAGGAQALVAEDPSFTFEGGPTQTIEYGTYWYFQATASPAGIAGGPWRSTSTFTGAPSGYTPVTDGYQTDSITVVTYITPPLGVRPLGAGQYTATVTVTPGDGAGAGYSSPPAQLTINPAALGIDVRLGADPSNPANAILSAAFTGGFVENFFSTSLPQAPLTPAGSWDVVVTDASGATVHEITRDRSDTDDLLAVSSYWSDVPPGEYTAEATFTPTGQSAENFTIAASAPVAYTATAPEGSTSTAAPAPPAPPQAEDAGLTLPLWVPIAAGVVAAGLLALMIVQIVRLRRAAAPTGATA